MWSESQPAGICRLRPSKSELEITALDFGLGVGLNLEKEHPMLPNIGASLEFIQGKTLPGLAALET